MRERVHIVSTVGYRSFTGCHRWCYVGIAAGQIAGGWVVGQPGSVGGPTAG